MESIPVIVVAFVISLIMISISKAKKNEKQRQQKKTQIMQQLQEAASGSKPGAYPQRPAQGPMPGNAGSRGPMPRGFASQGPMSRGFASQGPMPKQASRKPDSLPASMRSQPVSGTKKKEDGMKVFRALEDRNNDWLAKQLREERFYEKKFSAMYGLKRQHAANCDADSLRREHEENCDAEELRKLSRR